MTTEERKAYFDEIVDKIIERLGDQMGNLADLRIARDMKYTALYWNLRYYEVEENLFVKEYPNNKITIYAEKQYVINY